MIERKVRPGLRIVFAATMIVGAVAPLTFADETGPTATDVKSAIEKSLPLIEKSTAEYLKQRQCFSCHHQAMGVIALAEVRERGFKIDEENFTAQVDRVATHLKGGKENFLKGNGQGGQADSAAYALWTLAVGKQKADETTAAVAEYLLKRDKDTGHWRRSGNRPPSEASDFATTALAIRGLRDFGTEAQAERIAERKKQALDWLLKTKTVDTEDRVFRLYGLNYLGAEEKETAAAVKELLKTQRDDGGWSQTKDLKSDSYATGTALVALARYGDLSTEDSVYRRGLRYLLSTQQTDGSWHVKSRSKPFQKYFESGFPHGKDQFISMAGTCWATTALAMAYSPAAE
jgi:prenyltransferase beta subunit